MLRVDRQNQSIQKAATFGSGAIEQRVHGRCQPHNAQVFGERHRRSNAFAIDPAATRGRRFFTRRRLDACAECCKPHHALDFRGGRPGAVTLGKGEFFYGCTAKPAAWR